MSLTTSEMTPADIAAITGGNRGNDLFGDNSAWWLIILLLFGWGGNRDFGGGSCGAPCATQADLAAGFNNSAVLSNLNDLRIGQTGIQQTLCQGFNGVNTAVMQGFHGVDNAVCNLGYNIQSNVNNLSHQLSDCCCTTQRAIDGVRYDMAAQACDTRSAIYNSSRDIIDNANANSRAILDFLTQDKIATLTAENQSLRLAASQAAQNATLMAAMDANTAQIIRRTGSECPVPAYVVPNPNCCYPQQCAPCGSY